MDVQRNEDSPEKTGSPNSNTSLVSQRLFRSQRYKLKPRYYFGTSHQAKQDLQFLGENTVIHLVGRVVIVSDLLERTQRFVNLKEVFAEVNILALSPNKKYVAVSERKIDGPEISIYNLEKNKHIQTYRKPVNAHSRNKFQCITYTCDGAYLVAIVPEPDWKIIFYNTHTGKINCILDKVGKRSTRCKVLEICCHPSDPKQFMALGYDYYQLMKFKTKHWVPYGYEGNLNVKVTGGCWVTPIINVLGTYDGRLIFIEHGHIQGIYDASETEEIDLSIEAFDKTILNESTDHEKGLIYEEVYENEVKALVGFENGFAFSCKIGEVIVFGAQTELEHKLRWNKRGVYLAMAPNIGYMDSILINSVQQICISSNLNTIACTTLRQEIYYGNMKKDFHRKQANHAVYLKKLFGDLHQGPVSSISVARWKTMYMTVGAMDHSLILWNYTSNSKIFRKEYPEEIRSATIHPTGLFCLIGFTDIIRLGVIYNSGIKFVREKPVRACSMVVFSKGGHMFAAVCGVNIYVYSAINFSGIYMFKGHDGPVNCLNFTTNDYYIFSSGMEGSVFMWDVQNGERVYDYFTRYSATIDIDFLEDGSLSYLVGTDGLLRELVRGYLHRKFDLQLGSMYSVRFVNSGETLLVAGEEGIILAIGHPIFAPVKFRQYTMHTEPVRQMLIPPEENIMMSISDDGSVCLWDLIPPQGTVIPESPKSSITLEEKESGDSFDFEEYDVYKEEPIQKYTSYVIVDMENWVQGFEDMEDLGVQLIKTGKANDFILWQTQASFDMLMKHPDSAYVRDVAHLEMQIKAMDRDAVMKLHEWRAKLANMSVEDDRFDFHFTMRKYLLTERSNRITTICSGNLNKFFKQANTALKEFATCKNKTLAHAIDYHQQLEHKYSKAATHCRDEYSEFESMRDEDAYYVRCEIQKEIGSISEWNKTFQSNNKDMTVESAINLQKLFSLIGKIVHWIRANKESKDLRTQLHREAEYLRAERIFLNTQLARYAPIIKYTTAVNRSYLNRTYVMRSLVLDVRNLLEPLYAICRNRMLKYRRLEERFNDKTTMLACIKQRYTKFKMDHNSIRKAIIKSWKRSSSMARVFTNLENETLFRATHGYSPKALKSIFRIISKVYDKKIEKPEYNQELRKFSEIRKHKAFLKRVIHLFKRSVKQKVMTKFVFKQVPAGVDEKDISTLIYFTNRYIICSKVVLQKLKSLRNATNFDALGSTCEHARNIFASKMNRAKTQIFRKREYTRTFHTTKRLLNREIHRWRNTLEPDLVNWLCNRKNENLLRKLVDSHKKISQSSMDTCKIFD